MRLRPRRIAGPTLRDYYLSFLERFLDNEQIAKIPRWKKIVFSLIPIIVFLMILEVVLRMTIPFRNVRGVCFHPIMVRINCANVTGAIKYGVPITINSDGMIDREYPVARAPGTPRVAALGDSFTAGEETRMGQRFHELWEERSLARTGRNVEFLNFGVRSFGTWNELQIFHLKAAKYRPDLTVLNVFWGNDIEDNLRQLKSGAYNPLKEEYPDPSLWDRILGARKNMNKWLWNHVLIYQFFRKYYVKLEHKVKDMFRPSLKDHLKRVKKIKSAKGGSEMPAADSRGVYDDKFFDNSEGFKLLRQLILKLKEEAEAAGGRLAVIHFPSAHQVHDYPALPLKSFDGFLAGNGIPHLNLFPMYAALERSELRRTTLKKERNDYHFSAHGHEVYAKFTEDFIFSLLPKGPLT